MTSEEEHVRRAREAKHILEHELVVEAFDLMEAQFWTDFKASTPSQDVVRERIHRNLKTLEMFKLHLKSVMETGKIVSAALEQRTTSEEMHKSADAWERE